MANTLRMLAGLLVECDEFPTLLETLSHLFLYCDFARAMWFGPNPLLRCLKTFGFAGTNV
ncbi:uncharacterized protein G2W53_044505 [Senna tora]|uniref:Uncharacterized protein n=1 Tax=Senna tora TaxID=362788 RepID=A0A834SEW7_9FABA|nr:uncharacterized protein G2W53_044505 [Senna tora]